MKTKIIIYLLALLIIFGCSSLKRSMITTGKDLQDTAIYNAIEDFSTNCNLFKDDSVFIVRFEDSLFNMPALEQVNRVKNCCKLKSSYNGIVAVKILSFYYQFYYSEETKGKLPTKYMIKDGKLFYWWDDNYPLTEEMIAVLRKYNLLQTDFIIPEFSINDTKKSAHYYFCRDNLSKYKRVITNIGLGYYKPPRLKCN